jgi:hypothetical protein
MKTTQQEGGGVAQKGVVFSTTLSTNECKEVFQQGAGSARGGLARLTEGIAKVKGNGELTGYYTPSFDSPFAGNPQFAVGINIMGPMHGANGPGVPVHMYLDDAGPHREVQLVSQGGFTGGPRAAKLTRKFLEQFQAADPDLKIKEGNI